ncbi:MAG TPA: hypothetical protein PLN85_02810, partial [archaeon]|nr:hypothetical protein [archaeon]
YNIKDSYLRRFVKREKSKIEDILYLETKDEQKLKLKIIFISGAKYSTSLRAKARNIMKEYFKNEIKEKTLQEAWNDIIFQKLSDKCKQKLIKLGYVNKIIIAKAKRM